LEKVIEKCRHRDDRVGIDLADDAEISVCTQGFPAAGGEREGVEAGAGVVG
jgi:hypothetical protein